MVNPLKEICAKYIEGLPGAIAYFGQDKLDKWSQDLEGSAEFDQLFAWYQMGDFKDIQDWVANHTQGVTAPAVTGFDNTEKVEDYASILAFLNASLNDEMSEQDAEEAAPTPNNQVIGTIGNNIGVLRKAILYYQGKQTATQATLTPGN